MAGVIASLFTMPISAASTLLQGASCAVSTASLVSCCFQSAVGKKTGVSPSAAKMFYILLLGMCALVGVIIRKEATKFHFGVFGDLNCASDGKYCKGDQAVYRISFVLTLFFTGMMLMSLASEAFHRGYWGVKILLVIAGVIGSFFISEDGFDVHAFAWFARVGSLCFLVLQILILIDFAYQVNDKWVANAYGGEQNNYGEASNYNWLYAILGTSGAIYVTSLVAIVLLFVFYASCDVGIAFTTVTIIAVVVITVLALVRDRFMEREMQGAILPTAVVCGYMVFLCWSALESNPDAKCRPSAKHNTLDFTFGSIFATCTLMWTAFSVTSNVGNLVKGEKLEKAGAGADAAGTGGVELGGPVVSNDLEEHMVGGEEDDSPVYSNEPAWTFHMIMISASMYFAMLLTDWGSNKGPANAGEASMWMKIVSQWLTGLLFGWTLIAPAILKDRDFDY